MFVVSDDTYAEWMRVIKLDKQIRCKYYSEFNAL